VGGGYFECLEPARDAGGEWAVYILEGLLGRISKGRLAGFSDPIENPPGLGLLLSFVAQERVFESDVLIGGIQPYGLAKLIAGRVVFSDFQKRVCKVFVNGGAVRREGNSLT